VGVAGRLSYSRLRVAPRLLAVALTVAFVFLAVAAPAMAGKGRFAVTYGGAGIYTSRTAGHITNNNGRCTDSSTERTTFSFSGVAVLNLVFDKKGMTGDSYKLGGDAGDWVRSGNSSAHLTKSSTGPGCHAPDGSNLGGSYDCTGVALPQSLGVSEFKLPSAGRHERSHLKVTGPAVFTGSQFKGSWTYEDGSCGGLFGVPLLQTMANSTPFALGLNVPIRERTLRTLPVNHYFMVDVGEGHYAPAVDDAEQCAQNTSLDTCKQTFGWQGRIVVRRLR
jgi:hypothetical protein